jgi:glycine betaine/proline transport system substrate-binding protein
VSRRRQFLHRRTVGGDENDLGGGKGQLIGVRTIVLCMFLLWGVVAIVGTGASRASAARRSCGTVTINEGSWTGSIANVYVVKNVLETRLGCTVKLAGDSELAVFQSLAAGKVDAVLEDWQHVAQYRRYEQQLKVAEDAGSNGIDGHSGWFVPNYVVAAHPELATWKGLQRDWALFRTKASGSKAGELLVPDPNYVTNDQALIDNLHLQLKVVYAGDETKQIAQVKAAYAKKQPILFYWYTPQWLNAELELSEVLLPPRTPGCDTHLERVNCAYPSYSLRKVISTRFARSGSPAVAVIRRFRWTAQDQDSVAVDMVNDKLKPDAAAKKWIAANPSVVQSWLG